METITALVACGAAFALSYYLGHSRAPTTMRMIISSCVLIGRI